MVDNVTDDIIQDGFVSPGDQTALDDADRKREKAKADFEKVKGKALEVYQQDKDDGVTESTFEQWIANHNYPQYGTAEGDMKKAQTTYDTIYRRSQGKIDTLSKYRENVKDALNTTVLKPGYVDIFVQISRQNSTDFFSFAGLTCAYRIKTPVSCRLTLPKGSHVSSGSGSKTKAVPRPSHFSSPK
jgi:hypothetical protein